MRDPRPPFRGLLVPLFVLSLGVSGTSRAAEVGPIRLRLTSSCGPFGTANILVTFRDSGAGQASCNLEDGNTYNPRDDFSPALSGVSGLVNLTLEMTDILTGADAGLLNNFCIDLDGTERFPLCLDPPSALPIPNQAAPTMVWFTFVGSIDPTQLAVRVNGSHEWVGDLSLALIAQSFNISQTTGGVGTTGSPAAATTGFPLATTNVRLSAGTTGSPLSASPSTTNPLPGATTNAPSAASDDASSSSSSSTSTILIIVFGIVVLLLLILIAGLLLRRRRSRGKNSVELPAGDVDIELEGNTYDAIPSPAQASLRSPTYAAFVPTVPTSNSQYSSVKLVGQAEAAERAALENPDQLVRGEELGRGSYGVVFAGLWGKTQVAIKHMAGDYSAEQLGEFLAEAEVMRGIPAHPNVIGFLGLVVVADMNSPALVVELCDGADLEDFLEKNGPISQPLPILLGVARGMAHLAGSHIVHRE
jgi:Protein tyrosine and serine/threonine kinase